MSPAVDNETTCPGLKERCPGRVRGSSTTSSRAERRSPGFNVNRSTSLTLESRGSAAHASGSARRSARAFSSASSRPPSCREAIAGRRDHCGNRRADYRAHHHIARVVHTDVDPRVGNGARQEPDRHGELGEVPAHRVGEGEARRGVPRRERRGRRHADLARGEAFQPFAIGAWPGSGRRNEMSARRAHTDRNQALEGSPAPTHSTGHGDRGSDPNPQARAVRRVRERAHGAVERRRRRLRDGLIRGSIHRSQLTQSG